ncbi:MAG: right-handed parallel beta-helix repeat-containing protein [Saprospiraceae bacterium]|nr:right-handed parallel beta-helix repeat-containing protein [Saprospiraceae bacterium]
MNRSTFLPGLLCMIVLSLSNQSYGQVGINTTGTDPHPSAVLDVSSTDKGFLTPRMTSTEKDAIANPATGLLIYQTDGTEGFYYNQGTTTEPDWVRIGNESDISDLQTRIPIDDVAYFDTYDGTYADYVITQSGSYYLTEIINLGQTGGNCIVIDSDNVTLDMNGFAIYGDGNNNVNNGSTPSGQTTDPGGSGVGILVNGEHFNITIKDGFINSWQDDGIDASETKNSIFQNLNFRYNGQNGMSIGDQNLIDNCTSFFNVLDGIYGGLGNNFINCSGDSNGESAMQSDSSSQFISCAAYDNYGDGISTETGSLVFGCVVSENAGIGISVGSDCNVMNCSAYKNNNDGIRAGENSMISSCIAAINDGSGINMTGESGSVLKNSAYLNDISGIHCSNVTSADIKVDGNSLIDNDISGLAMESGGGFVVRNVATGSPTNYNLHTDTNRGPVVNVANQGDISGVTNADHPLANFEY